MPVPVATSGTVDPGVILQRQIQLTTGQLTASDQLSGFYVGIIDHVVYAAGSVITSAYLTIPAYHPNLKFQAPIPPVPGWPPADNANGSGTLCVVVFMRTTQAQGTSPSLQPVIIAVYPNTSAALLPQSPSVPPATTKQGNGSGRAGSGAV